MSVTGIVYLVNKLTRHINYAGEVPETYSNITGLKDVDYSVLRDLGATFGDDYKNLGFLTEAETLAIGITQEAINMMKAAAWEIKWNSLEDDRATLIQTQRWRVDRYNDELLQGRTPTENIQSVLSYFQQIRDLPATHPDPYSIVWPAVPPLPTPANSPAPPL